MNPLTRILDILRPDQVSFQEIDKAFYSRDLWPKTLIWVKNKNICKYPPSCIVWPDSTEEVVRVIQFAREQSIPVIPFGAGSGVCGSTIPICSGIIMDLKRLNRILSIDPVAMIARVQCGIIGQHLEMQLNHKGYTLGHFPSSIYCSTLGGYLATRSAGQCSSRYGKIEDMVTSLQCVTGTGEIIETDAHQKRLNGVDWKQIFIGSEGTLGVITEANMKINPAPVDHQFFGATFQKLKDGFLAIKEIMQSNLKPSVIRLYDEFDTIIARSGHKGAKEKSKSEILAFLEAGGLGNFLKSSALDLGNLLVSYVFQYPLVFNEVLDLIGGECLLILGFEGNSDLTAVEKAECMDIVSSLGGKILGEELGQHWFKNRYAISYKQSKVYDIGAFVDTMEVASTWDKLDDMYHRVKKAISPYAFVMAHFSHAYQEGCSIYFTFAGSASPKNMEALYDKIWKQGLTAVRKSGGSISHHHGVGLNKRGFMSEEYGPLVQMFRELKKGFDPDEILNPEKLFIL